MRALKRLFLLVLAAAALCFAAALGSALYYGGRPPPPDQRAEVAIVLGAGLDPYTGGLSAYGASRIETAVELYHRGQVDRLLITGGDRNPILARASDLMRGHALRLGAREADILMERRSRTTFENARFTVDLMQERGLNSAILVTSGFHMLRARLLFWTFDADVIGVAGADDLPQVAPGFRVVIMARETAAWPYNLAKLAGWRGLGLLGWSEEARAEWIR